MKSKTENKTGINTIYALIKTSFDKKRERGVYDAQTSTKLSPLQKRYDRFKRIPMKGREYALELVSFDIKYGIINSVSIFLFSIYNKMYYYCSNLRKMLTFSNILGLAQFKGSSEILKFIADSDNSQNFTGEKHIKFADNKSFKLWIFWSKTHVFVIRDDGFDLKILLKREKSKFEFNIVAENNEPRLYIHHTTTTLPISTAYSGSTASFSKLLKTYNE